MAKLSPMTFETFRHAEGQFIAFTDLETTGGSTKHHEIIEIGAVITTPDFEVIDEINLKVRPQHIETASAQALEVNGYDPADWDDAVDIEEALATYAERAVGATFIAYNAPFDWRFMQHEFETSEVENTLSGVVVCSLKLARKVLADAGLENFKQNTVAKHFGVPEEPAIHRAVNGARIVSQVYPELSKLL